MTQEHTKGPWLIVENLGMDEAWCNWHKVGPVDLMGGTADANSRLISAAPDLLEALLAVDMARHTDAEADWIRATALSDAAITKATVSNP